MSKEQPETKQPRKRNFPTLEEQGASWAQFSQEVVFAPLNDRLRLVGKNIQIGEIRIDKCIYDRSCSSLLLPWPSDPDVLLPYLGQKACDPQFVAGGGVGGKNGSHHITFVMHLPGTLLPVTIEGKLCCKINFLRFVVTEEACAWIHEKTEKLLLEKLLLPERAQFFEQNMKYALLGQSVLGRTATLTSPRGMVLMPREQFLKAPPNAALWQMMNHLFSGARTADDWGTLKTLEETIRDDGDWRDVDLYEMSVLL